MLAQTGSPSRAVPLVVGIFQATVAAHTGDEVDTVLRRTGTAEIYHVAECSCAAVAGITVAADIRIIQVGFVETGSPIKTLCDRNVGAALSETGVTLGAPTRVIDCIRIELVCRGVSGPEDYRACGRNSDHSGIDPMNSNLQ
jgi:hypothetical protein